MIVTRPRSVRQKLTVIMMMTSTTAVLLACLGFTISGLSNFRNHRIGDLSTVAELIGSSSTAALTFGDRTAAREVLAALRSKPSIVAAAIFTAKGEVLARYVPNSAFSTPRVVSADGITERDDRMELFYGIHLDHERIGTLYVASDARDRNARLREYAAIAGAIVLVSLLSAFALSSRLQGTISGPIVELARVARFVTLNKDFRLRATHRALNGSDEIGALMNGFNSMLAEIEQRDDRLLLIQTQLENTVATRTEELTETNAELLVAKNDAERIAELNAKLARESTLILNSATDGILVLDHDNHPTFLNPAGSRMIGMTISDMDGKSFHEAVHHSYPDGSPFPETACASANVVRNGGTVGIVEDIFWNANGSSFPVEYSSTPMVNDAGHQFGAVVIFRDITERQAVERLKSEFVSTVSHELRTPLTSIRGALGLLDSGLLGPIQAKGKRMLEIAITNSDRLVRLINDILDLERIGSGKVALARGTLETSGVMRQAFEGVQSMAEQAGVHLVLDPTSAILWGDSDRIIQTLTNLLGNAIKFSSPGTTTRLSGHPQDSDFLFSVTDQGRGIPARDLELIFERFRQVDASDSRLHGGSGLGLAICQSIVVAHGGRIWAESDGASWSRFQFTIPMAILPGEHARADVLATTMAGSTDAGR